MTRCDFFGGAYEVGVRPRVCLSCALQHGGVELSEEGLSRIFSVSLPLLDERQRRLMAAAMVEALGRGGQAPDAPVSRPPRCKGRAGGRWTQSRSNPREKIERRQSKPTTPGDAVHIS